MKDRIDFLLQLLGTGSAARARNRLHSLIRQIGCPCRLRDVGIRESDLPALARSVNVDRLSNNPRRIDAPGLVTLLKEVF
ncbi:MAG: iron-containing alcohol dehydrogenase [Gemmatimonas sp.]|nr:iron-containing alcohol dehydrogenase [Gemmatimonas sp.]